LPRGVGQPYFLSGRLTLDTISGPAEYRRCRRRFGGGGRSGWPEQEEPLAVPFLSNKQSCSLRIDGQRTQDQTTNGVGGFA